MVILFSGDIINDSENVDFMVIPVSYTHLFASNVCCAYKKRIYDELGGFTDTAIFNEDMIYAAKALKNGYISRYVSAARVIHSHTYTACLLYTSSYRLHFIQSYLCRRSI